MKTRSALTTGTPRMRDSAAWHGPGSSAATAALLATTALLPGASQLRAADAGTAMAASRPAALTLSPIDGTKTKRVTRSAKAAGRLGIQTGAIAEERVIYKQIVGGLVVPPPEARDEASPATGSFSGFGSAGKASMPPAMASVMPPPGAAQPSSHEAPGNPAPANAAAQENGELWLLTMLSLAEWDRLAKDRPARLLPLATRDKPPGELLAQPSGMAPIEDVKRTMLSVYYKLPADAGGLKVNTRMRIELELAESDQSRKVVPYSAIYYEASGAAWVYVSAQPLTYARQRIDLERVVGDVAVLKEGPPVGTQVVIVGAPLLYGAEVFGK